MKDKEFAEELVKRLNALLSAHEDIRVDISELLKVSVPESAATLDHPSLVVGINGLTTLGLLNGIVGEGSLITANCDEEKETISSFEVEEDGRLIFNCMIKV